MILTCIFNKINLTSDFTCILKNTSENNVLNDKLIY